MRIKKETRFLTVALMLLISVSLFGCMRNNTPSPQVPEATEAVAPTPTVPPIDDTIYIESDTLPSFWQGEWVCVYAEYYFRVDETIFIKDFDNAVLYTTLAGGSPWEVNRWFAYNDAEQLIHVFNEPPPHPEQNIRITFEIKRASEDEIVMTRRPVGQEVRFERPN